MKRYAKICIVVEEADETGFWFELIEDAFGATASTRKLFVEIDEIIRITSSIKNSLAQSKSPVR